MNIFPELFGNEKLKNTLGRDFVSGRFSHAYIIEGKDGFGKMTVALSCAAAVSCENKASGGDVPCKKCPSCRKIFGGISADVVTLGLGDKKTIGVEAVREMRNGLYITPNDGEYRFYIIENAEKMTVQAQNALLISLEEPPPYVVFFLLCEDSSEMLETIRSRAPIIRCEFMSSGRIMEFFSEYPNGKKLINADCDKAKLISVMCDGSVGRAMELCDEMLKPTKKANAENVLFDIAKRLTECVLEGRKGEAIEVVRTIPKGNQNARDTVDYCLKALRDLLSLKISDKAEMIFYADVKEAEKIAKAVSLQRLNDVYSTYAKYRLNLELYASEAVITTLLAVV